MFGSKKITLVACVFVAAACYGDTINLVTSPGALGANDSVLWSQLGADGITIAHSFSTTSVGGKTVTGSYAGTTGLVSVACPSGPQCSWGPATGITGGDTLNWAFDPAGNAGNGAGTGPITLNVPLGFGVGAIIAADVIGQQFTAKVELFNGATSLGFVTENSDASGDPIFIGARDVTAANVTKAVFSLTSITGGGDLGDFALDTLYLNNQVTTSGTPEPASALLIGGALLALGRKLRRRV
jgi:hypothetical protein